MCAKAQDQLGSPAPPSPPTLPVSASSPSLGPQELTVLEEIVLLQQAAQLYSIEPEEQCRAWFWVLERLSEKER